jgi:trypsin-like peptidase
MFASACNQIRETIYGVNGLSKIGSTINASNGTAFMIAPQILVTVAHLCHVDSDVTKTRHQLFAAIRSPDIGQSMETATFLAEDTQKDIALLQLAMPRSNACVTLETNRVPTGTPCGALGFPLPSLVFSPTGRAFNLTERFQSASISAYSTGHGGLPIGRYETDSFSYKGSSGCPGFLDDARVFGMCAGCATEQTTTQNLEALISIAVWVPALDIRDFARANGVEL